MSKIFGPTLASCLSHAHRLETRSFEKVATSDPKNFYSSGPAFSMRSMRPQSCTHAQPIFPLD